MVEKIQETGYEKSYTYAGKEYTNIDEYLDAQSAARQQLTDFFKNKKPLVKPEGDINNFITSLSQMASDTAISFLKTKIDSLENTVSDITLNVRDLVTRIFGAESFISKISLGLEEITTSLFSWAGSYVELENAVNKNTDDLNQLRSMVVKPKESDDIISSEEIRNSDQKEQSTPTLNICSNTGDSSDLYFAHEIRNSIDPKNKDAYTQINLASGKAIYIENICECPDGYTKYSSMYQEAQIPNSGCILTSTNCEYTVDDISFTGGLSNCAQSEIDSSL